MPGTRRRPGSTSTTSSTSGGRRLRVTQVKSTIGGTHGQRNTVRSLGLKRIGDVVVKEDRPEIRGMVGTVAHLVSVEEVE